MKKFLVTLVSGAALAFFLDPQNGSRRRNTTRDRGRSIFRRSAKKAQHVGGSAYGLVQERVPHQHDNPNPDDGTLKDRVESEVLRNPTFSRAPINFNVENGIVVIRGELALQSDIDSLIGQVRAIRDVKGVESYLHLPGTPAPNKEEAIRAS